MRLLELTWISTDVVIHDRQENQKSSRSSVRRLFEAIGGMPRSMQALAWTPRVASHETFCADAIRPGRILLAGRKPLNT